jgi:hypothetical protein
MTSSDAPSTAMTDGGVVTLVDLSRLRLRLTDLQKQSDSLIAQATSLRSLAKALWIERGRILLARTTEWTAPAVIAELVQRAHALDANEVADDAKLQSIRTDAHHGVGGIIGKVGDWSDSRKISADRANLDLQLQPALGQIGREAPDVTVAEADLIRVEAMSADDQAAHLESQAESVAAVAALAQEEIQRRTDAEHEMGFDAPFLAATLRTNGPPAIESPLVLKKGEQACLAVTATLARQQTHRQWVGGSQGFSFPIGHTGIRYRVGSYRGHPVEQQLLGKLDSGTLVVTNQRVAFIGATKSTSVALAKVLHVECYSDALAIFQEGRENPNYYYIDQPRYVLFFINWFLNQSVE